MIRHLFPMRKDEMNYDASVDPPLICRGWLSFVGPTFLRPEVIDHTPARLFYYKELFLAAGEDKKFNLSNVTGKCSILWSKDYATCKKNIYLLML